MKTWREKTKDRGFLSELISLRDTSGYGDFGIRLQHTEFELEMRDMRDRMRKVAQDHDVDWWALQSVFVDNSKELEKETNEKLKAVAEAAFDAFDAILLDSQKRSLDMLVDLVPKAKAEAERDAQERMERIKKKKGQ